VFNASQPGEVALIYFSITTMSAGPADFVTLNVEVPFSATHGAAHVLEVTSVNINEGTIPATADSAIHVAAYVGDATGNGSYSGLDSQRVARVTVGLDAGFAAYPVIDPVLVADVTGNGTLSALDAQRIRQQAVGLDSDEIPPIPQPLRLEQLPCVGDASETLSDAQLAAVAGIKSAEPDDPAVIQNVAQPQTRHELVALPSISTADRADLLTVVMPELGHELGHDHSDGGVMEEFLPLDTRCLWDEEPLVVDDYFAAT